MKELIKKNYDLVFNLLFEKEEMDRSTLFTFWDLMRCMDGEISCIETNNIEVKYLKSKKFALEEKSE